MNANRSASHLPTCVEKARLLQLYAVAEWNYIRAIQELSCRLGLLKTPNFTELHDFVESARNPMDRARTVLDGHTAEHGC